MKIERGVMAVKNGKGWGVVSTEARFTIYGWVDKEDAIISDPAHCKTPTDMTHEGSHYLEELSTAELVNVERRTETIIL